MGYVKPNYGKSINTHTHTYDKNKCRLQFTYNTTSDTLTIDNIKEEFSLLPFKQIKLSKNETFEQQYKNEINKAEQLKKTHEKIFNQIMKLKKIADEQRKYARKRYPRKTLQPPKGGKSRKIRKKYTKKKKKKKKKKS